MRVAARRKGKVRVSAGKLARAKTVRFKRRGRKTVKLKLTARGKRTLRGCGARRRVTVKAGGKRTRRLVLRRHCTSPPFSDAVVITPPTPQAAGFDTPAGCDFLDPAVCLQPWPNDDFTVPDPRRRPGAG